MSSKKRRKRRPVGPRTAGPEGAPAGRVTPAPRTAARGTSPRSSRATAARGTAARAGRGAGAGGGQARATPRWSQPSPYPPLFVSLAAGMRAVGSWPAPLAACFLGVLVLWALFSSYATLVAPAPNTMVLMVALPPLHNFLDIQFLASSREVTPEVAVAFGAGLLLIRGALLALWTALIVEWFRPSGAPGTAATVPGDPLRPSGRAALARAVKRYPAMLGIEAGFLMIALASVVLGSGFLGPSLGQLAIIGALMGGIYFLSFAPVVAVAEGRRPLEAARLSFRASRLPGPRHLVLAFTYTAIAIFVSITSPGSRVAPATIPIPVWGYVLLMSFVHVSVLAAFAFRWMVVRNLVPGVPGVPVPGAPGAPGADPSRT